MNTENILINLLTAPEILNRRQIASIMWKSTIRYNCYSNSKHIIKICRRIKFYRTPFTMSFQYSHVHLTWKFGAKIKRCYHIKVTAFKVSYATEKRDAIIRNKIPPMFYIALSKLLSNEKKKLWGKENVSTFLSIQKIV